MVYLPMTLVDFGGTCRSMSYNMIEHVSYWGVVFNIIFVVFVGGLGIKKTRIQVTLGKGITPI